MRQSISALALTTLFLTTSCASIVSKSNWPITINSTPTEARISITDKKGIEIYNGFTPAAIKLKSGSGFFGRARYQIKFFKEGYETKTIPVEFKLNGWYFGNLLFGGLIGMIIVDPATGAMYRIDNDMINETLLKINNANLQKENSLNILDMNKIPQEWKSHLVKLN